MKISRTVLLKSSTLALAAMIMQDVGSAHANSMLEEIVVRARKRNESVQDVPIAITALSGSYLQDRGTSSLDELTSLVPNMVSVGTGSSGANVFSIRGLSTTANNPGIETGIGLYVDEVYIGRSFAFITTLMDIDRVEVLRGPQGTLFGRNTVGGAINIFTSNPGEALEAAADLTYGNYDLVQLRGSVGGPIVEGKVFAKISTTYKKRDGYLKDFISGEKYNNEDSWSTRGKILVKASDSLDITLTADYYTDDSVTDIMDIRGGALEVADPYPLKERTIGTDFDSHGKRESYGFSGQMNWKLDGFDITSITSYRSHETDGLLDQDFSVVDISFTGREENQKQFSQELRLASDASQQFNYILGLYYFHQSEDAITTANLGSAVLGAGETAYTVADVSDDAYAAFASFNYDISEKFTISGGLRYTYEDKKIDYSQTLSDGAFLLPILEIAIPIPPLADSFSDSAVSGNISLNYKPTEDILTYLSYGRGFKAGGFNATLLGVTPDNLSFKPEYLDSYEIGLKSSWLEDRLRVNIAAFYMDYSDKQEQTLVGTTFLVANSSSARSKGFEIEVMARPHEQLQVIAGFGYTDAYYKSYPVCSFDGLGDPVDCSGNRLQNAPKYTTNLSVRYDQPVGQNLNLFTQAELNYRSASFIHVENNPNYVHQKLTLVNARIGIEDKDGTWSASFWGKNIFNQERQVLSFDFLGTDYAYLSEPRTYGIELRVKY